MLSIHPINAATASHYYEMDDYYAKENDIQSGSQWYGKGAKALGLTGSVQKENFLSLLQGKLPNGQQLGRIRDGDIEHQAGLDLTFSAPKSVSILAEVAGDKRLFAAHEKAVKAALHYLEKNAAQARIKAKGQGTQIQNTESLVAALFQHDTSRNQDPQLHTHCVIMNITKRLDSKWRSLTNEHIYDSKMTVGMIYRAQLAYELKQLGYEIEIRDRNGLFEIKGFPPELMQLFSSRREEIEAAIERFGFKGAEGAAKATLNTRKSKKTIEREVLQSTWQTLVREKGFSPEQFVRYQKYNPFKRTVTVEESSHAAVLSACKHLTERESIFSYNALIRTANGYGLGQTNPEQITKTIESLRKRGVLVQAEVEPQQASEKGPFYTTKEQLLRETEIRLLMQAGKGQCIASLTKEKAEEHLKPYAFNPQRQAAARMILTTQDRIVGIQGYAGTGKTHMLRSVKETLVDKQQHQLIGLAPSAAAARVLEKELQITSHTLHSFLAKPQDFLKAESNVQKIVIVDEASMVATRKMLSLLRLAKSHDFRVILVGDVKQLSAVEAGRIFYQLQKWGMTTVTMDEILRQKENPVLKAAIYDSIQSKIKSAFAKIGNRVIEPQGKENIHEKIANHWLSLSVEERNKTAVIIPDNDGREQTNHFIRKGLKKEGTLSGDALETQILVNKDLRHEEKAHGRHYKTGDQVLFNRNYTTLGVQKGEYYTVTQIHSQENWLTLQDKMGKTIEWLPHRLAARREGMVEVYETTNRELQVGDKIRWTKNQKEDGRINAQIATVIAKEGNQATFQLAENKVLTLNMDARDCQHWEYAYANTVHAIQGATVDTVLASLNSGFKFLTNLAAFYVEISRAKLQAYLYVDDKDKVIERLQKTSGEKSAALEIMKADTAKMLGDKLETAKDRQKTPSIESELNKAWSPIYDRNNDWLQRVKNFISPSNPNKSNPIETWYSKDVSVPWYVGDDKTQPIPAQSVENKNPTISKQKDIGLEI